MVRSFTKVFVEERTTHIETRGCLRGQNTDQFCRKHSERFFQRIITNRFIATMFRGLHYRTTHILRASGRILYIRFTNSQNFPVNRQQLIGAFTSPVRPRPKGLLFFWEEFWRRRSFLFPT